MQHVIDRRIVKLGDLAIRRLSVSRSVLAVHQCRQLTRRGMGEQVGIGDMLAGFVGLDDDTRHHERRTA